MGPAPISDPEPTANGVNLPSGNSAGGAATSVITDPANPATVFVGTANGGVWRSTDAGKTFAPLTDNQSSLSIGALAIDLTSPANARTLVAGFGNFSNANSQGGALNGLIVSHDGGNSWNPLGSATLTGLAIDGIVANGATILAASPDDKAGGLFRSVDGGTTFARVAGLNGRDTGLIADPSSPGRLYAAVVPADPSQARVVVSNDNGATWTTVFSAAQSQGAIGTSTKTLRIAVGPTGALAVGVVNTLAAPNGDQAKGLFLSANPTAGAGFVSLTLPLAVTADGYTFGLNPGGQASVNFAIAIDPNNPNIVYVSGDRQALKKTEETQDPSDEAGQKPDSIGASQYTATVFKVVVQPDGSSAFQSITDNFAGNHTAPHADTRALAFDANGNLLLGTDGGLYTRLQPNSPAGTWEGRNGGLGAVEAYQSAYDPLTGRIFVAAQDNGVSGQATPGGKLYNNVASGDGFTTAVDSKTLSAQQQSIAYLGVNSLSLFRVILSATGVVRNDALTLVVQSPGAAPIALAAYENPPPMPMSPQMDVPVDSQFVLNRIDPRLAAFGTLRVYTATLDPAQFTAPQAATPDPVDVTLTDLVGRNISQVTALAYGARDNPGALIAGAGGTVYVSAAAVPGPGTLVATQSIVTGDIKALVFDADRSSHFYAATGQSIVGTANSGASFTDLRGNLPTTFQNVDAAEFISSNGVRALFTGGSNAVAGAQSPIYVSLANALGTWTPFSTGLPNAIVYQLTYTPEADLLLVSTLGRGVWAIDDVTSNFASALQLQFGLANNDSNPGTSQLTDGLDANGRPFGRGLLKEGAATLTLTVPATYTGPTVLNAGTIRGAAASVFSPTSDHQLAAMTLLDLGGYNQTIGSLAGDGTVALGTGTLTTGGSGVTTVFAGAITGSGGLSKTGAGVFALTGVSSYTGPTGVSAGTLGLIGGSVLASGVTVQSGATLSAIGAVAGVKPAQVGGLNALPGSDLALSPVSATVPTLASTGAVTLAGTITVAPTVALEVSKIELLLVTGSTVADNRAVVRSIGALRAVADPAATSFSVLLVSGERDLAQGPLQTAVATAIDADVPAGRDVLLTRSLFADTVAAQGADLRALSGVGLTAYETAAVAGARRFQQAVGAHIAGLDTTAGPARQLALATGAMGNSFGTVSDNKLDAVLANAADAPPTDSGISHFWMEGVGSFGHYGAQGDAPTARTSSGGVVLGAETDAIPGTRLGAAFGYDKTSVRSEDLMSANVEAYRIAAFGRTSLGVNAPWIGASIDYSRSAGHGNRSVAVATGSAYPLAGSLTDRPDSDTVSGQVQVGQHFSLGRVDLVPAVAVQALHYEQGAFAEQGTTGAELALANRQRTAVRTVFGAAASRSFTIGGATVTPAASLGWAHELADRGAAFDAAFTAGGSVFRIDGVTPARDAALLAASIGVQAAHRVAVYVGYDATLARGQTEQNVTGGVRVSW